MTLHFSLCNPIIWSNIIRTELKVGIKKFSNDIRRFSQVHNIAVDDQILTVDSDNQHEIMADLLEPLRNMPYKEQLELKCNLSHQILEKIQGRLSKTRSGRKLEQVKVEEVTPSPVLEQYRNKDEFSIHRGVDGNPKTVGFFVGSPSNPDMICVPPTHSIIIKEEHKALAEVYQSFIRSSDLAACYSLNDGGCFRQFTVRSNSKGQTMAIAVSHPNNRSLDEIQQERDQLLEFFKKSGRMPTSLYHQTCRHHSCTNDQSPMVLLHGEEYLNEEILGYKFRISPDAFFQINVKAAEVMYEEIMRIGKFKSTSTLLDLCCGTGTISLVLSKRVRGCVGIETIKDAVKDARFNAVNNNVSNCQFIHGTVESKLFYALQDLDMANHLVTVVNPGRGGLNERVMDTILKCDLIKQLIYVSCAPNNPNTLKNFIQLLQLDGKKQYRPFNLNLIKPVDMFPQTRHCELLLVFNR